MIEVFRTNLQTQEQVNLMLDLLSKSFPACRINIDLEDKDKIVRVEGIRIDTERIIQIFVHNNFMCEIL
ncbi:MAG: hypothetical protein BGO34_22080 [Bacteroidia bacterium 44-10]|nr:MAG: hypothetical protein BGO34_22080 [Bacteroidia bacterium 44-10]